MRATLAAVLSRGEDRDDAWEYSGDAMRFSPTAQENLAHAWDREDARHAARQAEAGGDLAGRYVAGRDPRDAAEARQFAEWDASAQAEVDNGGWAGAGFTRP